MATAKPVPISPSELIFPLASRNFSLTLSCLKRSTLSTCNRLKSIERDSLFVRNVASNHMLPLIANERCGSWYIPPQQKAGSVYFKSTDGHFGEWSFSPRRLNLHVLDVIGEFGGCVIVDSTRRGKIMPDALSKTVPIWCVVINRLLFKGIPGADTLFTPGEAVGASEHTQIEERLNGFVEEARSLHLNIDSLRDSLKKPLRPFWITPNFSFSTRPITATEYHPVICCTASRRVEGVESSEGGYIQGAGDDSESWSQGLTPAVFWQYRDQLLNTVEGDIPRLVQELVGLERDNMQKFAPSVRIKPTNLFIGTLSSAAEIKGYDAIIICSDTPPAKVSEEANHTKKDEILLLHCSDGKLGSRALRTQLPLLVPYLTFRTSSIVSPKILFACPTGKDLSVGVTLVVLCSFFDDGYNFTHQMSNEKINKALIRRRLASITNAKPDANPSRSTLQSVHSHLMPRNQGLVQAKGTMNE